MAPPEFCHEKISPRLDGHNRFPPQGKARTCRLITLDGGRQRAQL
jgi:hypothetical protein